MTTVKDVIKLFEKWVPITLAESWDNVGLQIGSKNQPVHKLMITLDVVEEVVDEAVEGGVDMIIAHHPLLFKGIKSIDFSSPKGRVIQKLIQHNISVYAAHTNLDVVEGGVNDWLAERLELQYTKVLVPTTEESLLKFVVYVPRTHVTEMLAALGEADAGHIGNYSHCSYRGEGTGAFKPLEGSDPFIGKEYKMEEVEESKVETIIKKSQLSQVLQAAQKAHPYEEMAYDLLPLANKGEKRGLGRIGTVKQPITLANYASLVKEQLQVPTLRYVGDPEQLIKKVAVLGGSGKGFIDAAKHAGADVYVTGDLTFHDAQDAEQAGFSLIDPGHHVEEVMKQGVKRFFSDHMEQLPNRIEIKASKLSTEPFRFI
ncbi:Nif3-like dinuclear metal center hexameric protein [Gracilibacillus caseinilyticus]|uniref:GTP cyclohydrolase 1 type 2 homolog n=1 Tax=Gracilibacillus caseinilyticus TaxID=2932256 RepID=A0ABY4ET93_9BACI|nr:Nif3-like dinuclear metal center hexameric protein [Gracilibacillus caseinilyticus]UOQ47428.1 Nif3-like dinuclear metal center hexameric protein [Gracilibacillus caseinilyticus]